MEKKQSDTQSITIQFSKCVLQRFLPPRFIARSHNVGLAVVEKSANALQFFIARVPAEK